MVQIFIKLMALIQKIIKFTKFKKLTNIDVGIKKSLDWYIKEKFIIFLKLMKNILINIMRSYKRYGLISFVNQILSKIGLKMRFKDPIQKKRIYLSKKLNELTNGEIIDGIYKGSKLIYSSDFLAKPAQLLGCYEKEVQKNF